MIRNTRDAWGGPAVAMHWAVALLVFMTFGLGLWMSEVPARADRPYYFAIHASLGITLLAILAVRLVWAVLSPRPQLLPGSPRWQHTTAELSHVALYALTFGAALLGWVLAGSLRTPIEPKLFGLLPLAAPITFGRPAKRFIEGAHEITAYMLMAFIGVHALAALWHHYIRRDDTLRRMLSAGPRPVA